jgi:MFS family permease
LRFLWNDKRILKLVVSTALIGFGFNIAGATLVLFLTKTLEVPQALFGLLLLSGGVGGLLGAWAAPKLSSRFGRGSVLAWSITLTSIFGIAQGLSPNMFVFAAASVLVGFAIANWNVLLMSVYHTLIPSEVFGRVHGTRRTIVWGIMPIGALIGGLIARLDLRAPMLVGGAFSLLIALVAFRMIRQLADSSDNT